MTHFVTQHIFVTQPMTLLIKKKIKKISQRIDISYKFYCFYALGAYHEINKLAIHIIMSDLVLHVQD